VSGALSSPSPHLKLSAHEGVLTIWLNRPEKKNAMNAELVGALQAVMGQLQSPRAPDWSELKVCVLRGEGGTLCAGGDIEEMKGASREELQRLNRDFGELLLALWSCPIPLISVAEGVAMGGGLGLVSVSDYCLGDREASFALPEVRLGLTPAQIAPFVSRRIGAHRAAQLALSAERFSAERAHELGLLYELFEGETERDERLARLIKSLLSASPQATRLTKRLFRACAETGEAELPQLLDRASEELARQARSAEGREGLTAFLERRSARW